MTRPRLDVTRLAGVLGVALLGVVGPAPLAPAAAWADTPPAAGSPAPAQPEAPPATEPPSVPAPGVPSPAPAAPTREAPDPAERVLPRPPQGVPQVFTTEKPGGGPVIELPPDEAASAPAPGPETAISPERTSQFAKLSTKVSAIVNRTVLGGYGEFVFTKRQGEDSFFEPRRFIAFLYSPIHDRISVMAEIEYEHGGTPQKREGQLQAGEVQLEFAALDIRLANWLSLRGGIVLVPMGRLNINHDAPTLDLTDRPLTTTYLIPSTWFEAGAGILGKHRFASGVELNHELYVINGLDSKISSDIGYRGARGSKFSDNNDDKAVVGRVGMYYFGPLGRRTVQLDLGVSGYTGAYNRRGARTLMVAADLAFRVAGFELLGEYARGFNEPGFDDDYPSSGRLAVPTDLWGLYVEAHYHLMPSFLRRVLPGWLKQSVFTLALRYDLVDTDMKQKTPGDRQRLTFGLNYRFIEPVVWKHELQLDHNGPANPFDAPKLGYVTSFAFLF